MLDDHSPFNAVGIPTIDLIDFDFPPWHTAADTMDKLSAQSLQIGRRRDPLLSFYGRRPMRRPLLLATIALVLGIADPLTPLSLRSG